VNIQYIKGLPGTWARQLALLRPLIGCDSSIAFIISPFREHSVNIQ
jgi:hypothetical protein